MSLSRTRNAAADSCRAAAVGAAAFAACDSLHELGHLAAAQLPLQVSVLSISSVGVSTSASSPLVAIAGPLANLLLAGTLLLARSANTSANWRYFAWLFGSLNLFNFTAYLIYSALLGSGDWAAVFNSFSPSLLWRPVAGLAGVVLYAVCVFASLSMIRMLIATSALSQAQAKRYCLSAYWAGGSLLVVASALNPISPWLILTSGVATGFGAMAGLAVIGALLNSTAAERSPLDGQCVHFDRTWVIGCIVASLTFVLVLGRGIQFIPSGV